MPTAAPAAQIRADFDRIAPLTSAADAEGLYDRWLLAQVPPGGEALEIGCGVGALARKLAGRFGHVDAIDFSEGMIAEARRREAPANVAFHCVEMFDWLAERRAAYDCIVTVGTLHHVELDAALAAMARALRPGGTLVVLDLVKRPRWSPSNLVAYAVAVLRNVRVARHAAWWRLRAAYVRHGENETYLTRGEVQRAAYAHLPHARIREHLLWRYSMVWTKPGERGITRRCS